MADDTIDSQGTELFLSFNGTTVTAFDCPTAITGMGFTTNEMDNGCLSDTVQTTKPGKKRLNSITVPYRVISGSVAHRWLMDQTNQPSVELPYCIGWADGTADPSLSAGAFQAPGGSNPTRTCTIGTCFVGGNTIDFNDGEVVTGTFTFSPQSQTTVHKN